jgi:hypothetical protein
VVVLLLGNCGIDSDAIGIVTPYAAQVALIRNELRSRSLRVGSLASVDKSQGSERDVILVSTVRSNNHGAIGHVKDARRLNVALTRARRAVILFGNEWTLVQRDECNVWNPFFKFFAAKQWIVGRDMYTQKDSRAESQVTEKVNRNLVVVGSRRLVSLPLADCYRVKDELAFVAARLLRRPQMIALLEYVVGLSVKIYKLREWPSDVLLYDRKIWSHYGCFVRLCMPADATNYVYYFVLMFLHSILGVDGSGAVAEIMQCLSAYRKQLRNVVDATSIVVGSALERMLNRSGDIIEAIAGICDSSESRSSRLLQKLKVSDAEARIVHAELGCVSEQVYLLFRTSSCSPRECCELLGIDVDVANASSCVLASGRDVMYVENSLPDVAGERKNISLRPPWVHWKDQRWNVRNRELRWTRCDFCEAWKMGNNCGCFVYKQPGVKACDRWAKYKSGEFDATWYCVDCLERQGFQDMVSAMLKRKEARSHYKGRW